MKDAGKIARPANCFLIWTKKMRPFLNNQLKTKTENQKKVFLLHLIPDQKILLRVLGDWSILEKNVENKITSKILGAIWTHYVSSEEKREYKQKQHEIKKQHQIKYPKYIYKPKVNKSKITNHKLTNHKLTNHKLTNHKLTNNKLTNHKLTNNKKIYESECESIACDSDAIACDSDTIVCDSEAIFKYPYLDTNFLNNLLDTNHTINYEEFII